MGICFPKATQPKYKDEPLNPKPSAVVPTSSSPIYCESTPEPSTAPSIPTDEQSYSEAESNLPRVQLIGDMLCPFTLRVQIALQFKGVVVDPTWLTPADLTNPKLVTASPTGKYPVLHYGLHKLSGSTDAMLDYIDETFEVPSLIPKPVEAEVMQWVAFIRDELTPIVGQLLYDGSPLVQQELEPKLESCFMKLDSGIWEHGKQGRFFFGNQFTFVDVYLIPILLLVDVAKFFRGIEISTLHSHLLAYSRAMHSFPNYSPVRMNTELLKGAVSKTLVERAPSPLIVMTVLQHRSILSHLERLVALADGLPVDKLANEDSGRRGVAGKQMQLLWKMYGRLLDLMQEHAQMEERVIFPAIESTEEGMSECALADHARDLPVMNGIREDIKGVMALEQGCSDHLEGLQAVVKRLHALQENSVDHYHEEERDLLPQLNAAGLGNKKQEELVSQSIAVMEETHGRLLPFFLQGLEPHEISQYIGLLHSSCDGGKSRVFTRMSFCLKNADDEFKEVCMVAQRIISELAAPSIDKAAGS